MPEKACQTLHGLPRAARPSGRFAEEKAPYFSCFAAARAACVSTWLGEVLGSGFGVRGRKVKSRDRALGAGEYFSKSRSSGKKRQLFQKKTKLSDSKIRGRASPVK